MRSETLLAIFAAFVTLLLTSSHQSTAAASPPPCTTDIVEELPPRFRKICAALATIAEFSSAMEQYLDDKVLRENAPLLDNGVKRQDVDHVFLRFGRRR